MEKEDKKILKVNIFFIFLFLIFLLIFPALRANLSDENSFEKSNNANIKLLSLVKGGSRGVYNIFPAIKDYFVSKNSLLVEIQILKSDLEAQNLKIANLEAIKNTTSPDPASGELTEKNVVSSQKIFKDFTSIYDTLLLDKGFLDSVEKGDLVFLYPNLVIGEIENINRDTSLLKLYSKSKNKVEAFIKTGAEDVLIDVYGIGSGDFYAEIPENINIATATLVYLASDASKVLGEVVRAEKREASFFQDVLIRGYHNTRLRETYYILLN